MINSNETIKQLINNGNTYTNIGKLLGISREAVRQRCVKMGIKRKPFNYELPKTKTRLQLLKESGLKWCGRCKRTENEVKLLKHSHIGKKQYYQCQACNADRIRAYYHTDTGKKVMLKAKERYLSKIKK